MNSEQTLLALLSLCLIVLSSGCMEQPHRKGESCTSNSDCLNGVPCLQPNGGGQGICGCSPKETECKGDTDCCEGLACRKDKCVELSAICVASPIAGYLALGGIIVAIVGILIPAISGGFKWSHPKYGTLKFIGSGGFILIGIIAVIVSLILWGKC
jgi:hypothetical protein